ncbi:MAG: hypothetical protein HRU09_09435 [Oligoflexales bacterium]|nr:hypothetical protein [Oligoflexales bacterium]
MRTKRASYPFSTFLIASIISGSSLSAYSDEDYRGQAEQNQQQQAVDYVPIVEARNVKQQHQQDLDAEKEHRQTRYNKWSISGYKEKIKHKMKAHKLRKEKRKAVKERFGEEYRYNLANDITKCSTKLIEKHYAGTASFIEGAGYLKSLQTILRSPNNINGDLESLYQHCQDSLTIYKKDKKSGKIRRDKIFSDEQKFGLSRELHSLFPNRPELVHFLERAYSPDMDCHNPKGGTLGIAFGLGGYGGAYRQKCRTPLGRRFKIYKLHGGLNWGAGGVASTSAVGNLSHHPKVPAHSTPHRVKYDHNSAAALAVGAGVDVTVPGGAIKKVAQSKEDAKRNASKVQALVSPAVGFGIYFGVFGLSGESKKELQPDFDDLYSVLGVYDYEDVCKPYDANPF